MPPFHAHRRRPALVLLLCATMVLATGGAHAADEEAAVETVRDRPLPERWEARYIREPVFDSRMYVVEAGPAAAPPVLLVHGLGQSGYQDWWETIEALESDHRVIALDLPGFARSSVPSARLSPPRYARLLDWLARELDLQDIHLVGHSMGAAVALYYAGTYPERIEDVVLVDAAGILQRVAFLRAVAAAQADGYDLPGFIADRVRGLFEWGSGVVERFMLSSEMDVVELLRRSDSAWNALLADRPNVNAAVAMLETDFSRVLERFDRPVTIIWGEQDSVAPIRTGHMLHGMLPDSRFHVIEGAAHVPMRSHTQTFLGRLRSALDRPATTPDEMQAGTSTGEDGQRSDYTCRGRTGRTISGRFDRVVLDDCPGARLIDVRARRITIDGSDDVRLRHVHIEPGEGVGLGVTGSTVTATDLSVTGEPAVRVDAGRLDVAGGTVAGPAAGLVVERRSTIVFSVTRLDSGRARGHLHGAVRAADAVLDRQPELRSQAAEGKTVQAPTGAAGSRLLVSGAR